MQEIDRKILLEKTHRGLCKEMGIACELDFTKYDLQDSKTVSDEGYCIKTKDINNIPYPLDTIILEQAYKLHIKELINNDSYTPKQKEELTMMLFQSLQRQKQLILENIKKRQLKFEG